jgi:chromate transporter
MANPHRVSSLPPDEPPVLPHFTVEPPLVDLNKRPATSLWQLFRIWFQMGLQSFGGGMATLYMIRRAVVDQQGWLTAGEFARDWALCQAAPGINLICMTILVGRQVAGIPGALVAVFGLLFPSVAITITMTALYASFRDSALLQSAIHGVVPATVGLGLLLSASMARPLLAPVGRQRRGVAALATAGDPRALHCRSHRRVDRLVAGNPESAGRA